MNTLIKSKPEKHARIKRSRNNKSVSSDTYPDKKNQTKRLLTAPERALIAEYHRHHPLSRVYFCPDFLVSAGIAAAWGAA